MNTPPQSSAARSSGHEDCPARELQSAIDKVQAFGDLEPNWDSYGALTIDPASRQMAVQFLQRLDPNIPIPSVVPTVHGGVQLEWHCRGVHFEVEFQPSGELGVYFEDLQTGEEQEFELAEEWQALKPFLNRLGATKY